MPTIEQTNELVRSFNASVGAEVLVECSALLSSVPRLPGLDGRAKMSKSLGYAIPLAASPDEINGSVKSMYTDPNHLRVEEPGTVEGNLVFAFLDAFEADTERVAQLKAHYRRGGLGDSMLKRKLEDRLQALIAPMRERRARFDDDRSAVLSMLKQGTRRGREKAATTLGAVKRALGLDYFA